MSTEVELQILTMGRAAVALLGLGGLGCGQVDLAGQLTQADAGLDAALRPRDAGIDQADAAAPATLQACATAPEVFGQALCACDSVSVFGDLTTQSMHRAGGVEASASVHVRGPLHVSAFAGPIDGDLGVVGHGTSVLSGEAAAVSGDLHAAMDLGLQGALAVEGNAWLSGALFGEGMLHVAGDVHAPTSELDDATTERLELGGDLVLDPVPLSSPCACSAADTEAIASWVQARADDNDNASLGFETTLLEALPQDAVVQLPPGRLFAEAVHASGALELRVTGPTSLFVDEGFQVEGPLTATLDEGAELAIFVRGDASVGGELRLAPPGEASRSRMYVAGAMQVTYDPATMLPGTPAAQDWVVNLYAPALELTLEGQATVSGSLHVGSLTALDSLLLRLDERAPTAMELCDAQ